MHKGASWAAALFLLAAPLHAAGAAAQEFPGRPIRVITPFPAGGPVDALARVLGEGFRERSGQMFIIEPRPGANTSIAANACKSAEADGYTICLLSSTTMSINPHLYSDLRYTAAEFAPVTNVAVSEGVFLLRADVPANNLAELVEWSKKNPDKMNYGSFGIGSEPHLMFEWLKNKTGLRMTHVPFQGFAPALLAFDGAEIQAMAPVAIAPVLDRIETGKAKALMIVGDHRHQTLPKTPTIPELGMPPLNFQVWFGMFAPAGVPKERVEKISAVLRDVITQKTFIDKYVTAVGMVPAPSTPDEFKAFLAQDAVMGGELVKVSGVRLNP